MRKYRSSKTYGHDVGLSCAFRQWRAKHSHCRFIHGYALSVHIEFETYRLDDRHWVIDFGGLKSVKEWLKDNFDHKLVVASDDPQLAEFRHLVKCGLAEVVVLPRVGCESFAEHIFDHVEQWLIENDLDDRVKVHHVTVREHGANSATVERRIP